MRCRGHREPSSASSRIALSALQEQEREQPTTAATIRPRTAVGSSSRPPPKITPLARFNNHVNYHRHDVDSNGASVISDNADFHFHVGAGTRLDSSSSPPVIDFVDLMHMAFSSATSDEMFQKRRDFSRELRRWGGYGLVEMNDPIERGVVDGMWDAMERLFSVENGDHRGGDISQRLHRQVLKRSITNSSTPSTDNPGYDFVQTSLVENILRPDWIQDKAGELGARQARNAYMLLAQLCKAFAVVAYAGAVDAAPSDATALLDRLLIDDRSPYSRHFSGSYHRLCRYLPLGGSIAPTLSDGNEKVNESSLPRWGESLRPHVDWTISTAIPVSSVAGLEVYAPSESIAEPGSSVSSSQPENKARWIRVEQAVRKSIEDKVSKDTTNGDASCGDNPPLRWNSRYVVVFAGAWLEVLTQNKIEATLHRVVTRRPSAAAVSGTSPSSPRLSAPFFLRPHELVFEKVEDVFDNPENEAIVSMSPTEAVREMSRFLHEFEFRPQQ